MTTVALRAILLPTFGPAWRSCRDPDKAVIAVIEGCRLAVTPTTGICDMVKPGLRATTI
jgi:hypothetical protein